MIVQHQERRLVAGASSSMVHAVESSVIIPGNSHEELWVHPNLVTAPGDPVVIELALRTTDRRGGDRHSTFHYFRTGDDFRHLEPIARPGAAAWQRIGLGPECFSPDHGLDVDLRDGVWHWARNSVPLDAHTILCPYLVRHGPCHAVRTVIARRDGERWVPLSVSNALGNPAGRGLLEPQIAAWDGQHYMTMRAEDGCGYVAVSADAGHSWAAPAPWRWDDGTIVPMASTMTKLLSHSDGLLLVYTRVRADNNAVFRHRAPLHCADVDPATLSLRRFTERVIVPNRGLPVGNFWVWPLDPQRSYVVVAEWPRDGRTANGDCWLARIRWRQPNRQLTPDGHECRALQSVAEEDAPA